MSSPIIKEDPPKITRSRNGCLQCRKSRKKCDETKPSCKRCSRLKHSCSFSIRIKSGITIAPRGDLDEIRLKERDYLQSLPALINDKSSSSSSSSDEEEQALIPIQMGLDYTLYPPINTKEFRKLKYIEIFDGRIAQSISNFGDEIDNKPWVSSAVLPMTSTSVLLTEVLASAGALYSNHKLDAMSFYGNAVTNMAGMVSKSVNNSWLHLGFDTWFCCLVLTDIEMKLNDMVRAFFHLNGAIIMLNTKRRMLGRPLRQCGALCQRLYDTTVLFYLRGSLFALQSEKLPPLTPIEFLEYEDDVIDKTSVSYLFRTLKECMLCIFIAWAAENSEFEVPYTSQITDLSRCLDGLNELSKTHPLLQGEYVEIKLGNSNRRVLRFSTTTGSYVTIMRDCIEMYMSRWPTKQVLSHFMAVIGGLRYTTSQYVHIEICIYLAMASLLEAGQERRDALEDLEYLYPSLGANIVMAKAVLNEAYRHIDEGNLRGRIDAKKVIKRTLGRWVSVASGIPNDWVHMKLC